MGFRARHYGSKIHALTITLTASKMSKYLNTCPGLHCETVAETGLNPCVSDSEGPPSLALQTVSQLDWCIEWRGMGCHEQAPREDRKSPKTYTLAFLTSSAQCQWLTPWLSGILPWLHRPQLVQDTYIPSTCLFTWREPSLVGAWVVTATRKDKESLETHAEGRKAGSP